MIEYIRYISKKQTKWSMLALALALATYKNIKSIYFAGFVTCNCNASLISSLSESRQTKMNIKCTHMH
jgi:hypothetical protein